MDSINKNTNNTGVKFSILSGKDYCPRLGISIAELYTGLIEQAELADRLGYHALFIVDNHLHKYGMLYNPAILLACLAQRTKHLKLGAVISSVGLSNPEQLAEAYATVDILSNKRLILALSPRIRLKETHHEQPQNSPHFEKNLNHFCNTLTQLMGNAGSKHSIPMYLFILDSIETNYLSHHYQIHYQKLR